jgi:hypothetical protein
MKRAAPTLFLLLASLPGCKSGTKATPNPDFTYEKVVQGGFVLGGVTTLLEEKREQLDASNSATIALGRLLGEKRQDLRVRGWSDFRRAVGDSTALRCLADFRDYGKLDSSLVDTLAGTLGGDFRYLIMARIERDLSRKYEKDATENVAGETKKIGRKYLSERCATVMFGVYDFTTHNVVWGTVIDGRVTSEHLEEDPAEDSDSGTFLDGVANTVNTIDAIFGGGDKKGSANLYPDPPDFEVALDKAFDTFTWQLPKVK